MFVGCFDIKGASAGFGEKDRGVHGRCSGGSEVEEEAVMVMERFSLNTRLDFCDVFFPVFFRGVLFRFD